MLLSSIASGQHHTILHKQFRNISNGALQHIRRAVPHCTSYHIISYWIIIQDVHMYCSPYRFIAPEVVSRLAALCTPLPELLLKLSRVDHVLRPEGVLRLDLAFSARKINPTDNGRKGKRAGWNAVAWIYTFCFARGFPAKAFVLLLQKGTGLLRPLPNTKLYRIHTCNAGAVAVWNLCKNLPVLIEPSLKRSGNNLYLRTSTTLVAAPWKRLHEYYIPKYATTSASTS